ncbi:MAG: c-type cytochrome [Anaerolineales bacterium]|nr:c-type cytochrome [Anaerolineales bacterium]
MTWRVIVGTLSFVLTMILFGYVAVSEQDRMATFDTAYQARQIETGGQLYESNCATCHGLDGKGSGRAPALNSPDLLAGNPPQRLKDAGWGGTLRDYIHTTVAGGRPQATVKFADYPERMPTWSQEFGGPMRSDQVDSVVAYVMNWALNYQNFTPAPEPTVVPVGTDITVELPAGDAAAGEQDVTTVGCTACHISVGGATTLGPAWLASSDPNDQGMGTRAPLRLEQSDYTGKATSGAQYLFESIVNPDAYIVPGGTHVGADGKSIMPHNYGTVLDAQKVADIIAYLESLK